MTAYGAKKSLIFISYSHKDEVWKDRLRPHIDMFRFDSELVVWDDRQIKPTAEWYDEIKAVMERATIAICLISPDYLSSDFCRKHEIPYLLERHAKGEMVLLFILIRPCAWNKLPWLAAHQMLPRDNRAISSHFADDWDTPFAETAGCILDELNEKAASSDVPLLETPKHYTYAKIDITRLPTSGLDIVGRQDEVAMLDDAWASETAHVVSLRAWGGVGKSTLVNKWCAYLAADNFRGARRVFAWSFYSQGSGQSGTERVTSADAFIDEALRFFGDPDPTAGSPWSKGERLAELVGKEKALLILDGMEPLQDEHQGIEDPALARLVECLAAENAGLCVITTREPVKELSDFPDTTREMNLEQLSKEAGQALLRIKGLRADDDLLEQASEAFGNHALALNLLASYLTRFADGDVSQALAIPDLPDISVGDGKHPRRVMAAFAKKFGEGPEMDLLHVMGLFDRPADAGCIASLRGEPAVPGLTERLSALDEIGWRDLLAKLRDVGLLAETSHHAPDDLDAHPLVREHFGAWLRDGREDAWKAGHDRLYDYLQTLPRKHQPDTLAEMAPLFQAIYHGCAASMHQEAFFHVYRSRISRKGKFYLARCLGGIGANFGAISAFFDEHGRYPNPTLRKSAKEFLIVESGINLRSLGRLGEALVFHKAALEEFREDKNWTRAAIQASSISRIYLSLGEIDEAATFARKAIKHIDHMPAESRRSMTTRAALADALHQKGALELALAWFEEAETLQERRQPKYPLLSGLQGYDYCQLLLTLQRACDVPGRAEYALEIVHKHAKNLADIALNHISLGRAAIMLGNHREARQQLD